MPSSVQLFWILAELALDLAGEFEHSTTNASLDREFTLFILSSLALIDDRLAERASSFDLALRRLGALPSFPYQLNSYNK